VEQLLEHRDDLHASQVGAQAEVRADAETQMRVGVAGEVELIRLVEDTVVAVGPGVEHEDPIAFTEVGVAVGVILGDGPDEAEHGADESHDLVGGPVHELGVPEIVEQELALVGELGQGDQPTRQRVAGGLVAGDEQHGEECEQLVVVELGRLSVALLVHALDVLCGDPLDCFVVLGEVTGVEGGGEDRDEVVGGVGAPAGDQLDAHRGVLAEGGGGLVEDRVVGVDVAVTGHHGVGPAVHVEALLGVESEDLADDDERDVHGELVDEVDRPLGGDLVDHLIGELTHVGDELPDPARGEALVDESSLADVLGTVERDDRHVAGDERPHPEPGAVALGVPGDGEHVLVSGGHPEIVGFVAVETIESTEGGVGVPGVVERGRVAEVDRHQVDGLSGGRTGGAESHGSNVALIERSFNEV